MRPGPGVSKGNRMAPIKVIKPGPRVGTGATSTPTVGAGDKTAPTNAPAQIHPLTGEGMQAKTAPTFNQSPKLAPKPPDNGSTKIVDDQRQPAPKGPRAPLGGNGYGN
jgi:hypothetical protein